MLDGSCLIQTVVVDPGNTCGLSSRVLAICRGCMTVLARSRWFLPVQDSLVFFWMDVVGFIWLFIILFGFGWFRPVQDGSGRFWYDLAMLFSRTGLFRCCFTVLASSRWLLPVQQSCCCVWIVVVGSIWHLKVFYGIGCFWPVLHGSLQLRLDL